MPQNDFLTLRRRVLELQFAHLNDAQRQALFATEGPLLVLAGAGSGKTTVIVNRIAALVQFGQAHSSDDVFPAPHDEDCAVLEEYLSQNAEHLPAALRKDGYVPAHCLQNLPQSTADKLRVDCPRPWEILAVTFTNKAAGELKNRLERVLGDAARDIWAGTFHSMCAKLLRRHAALLGFPSNFTIYDTDDQKRAMKECFRALGKDEKLLAPRAVQSAIGRAKDMLISPKTYLEENGGDMKKRHIGELYAAYQKQLFQAGAMDFDDLIYYTVKLLQKNPEILQKYQRRFRYVLVDEYQDTNKAQDVLTALLAEGYGNLCVVGDDDQSIYKFRGATVENILSFEERFPGTRVIRLEENYRSAGNILDAANAVIAKNEGRKGKTLWTHADAGKLIAFALCEDERQEGSYVADCIMADKAVGEPFAGHAVLYRMNAQSNMVETALTRRGIPYRVLGGMKFYDRKEIRDALAYLQILQNEGDIVRLRRIINEPKRGLGEAAVTRLLAIAESLNVTPFAVMRDALAYPPLGAAANKLIAFAQMIDVFRTKLEDTPLANLLEELLVKTGYQAMLLNDKEKGQERKENLAELGATLARYQEENPESDLAGFLQEVALQTDLDGFNADDDAAVLMTLHSAKGLEFPTVFLIGLEEGVFPGTQALYSPDDLEEERRLAYVGITRARRSLHICAARQRMVFGHTGRNPVSRFVRDIPTDLLEEIEFAAPSNFSAGSRPGHRPGAVQIGGEYSAESPFASAQRKTAFMPKPAANTKKPYVQYQPGECVRHKSFGDGKIIKATPLGNDTLLEIAFEPSGIKKLMANYARLEKVGE
ncbi:MAG: UvrD-helicase domain-containing protein [Oscillospiraceae bacterium]|jgi:DNA helicase-2/ATP-dependent DNA helicase PcrA|nr:UvrD-helicase domain-containing protein [Oscillospiraceae bacterium]